MINPHARKKEQMRRAKLISLIIVALVIIQLVAFRQTILNALGEHLIFQQPTPQQADVIVILGNWDDTIVRVRAGADLYKAGVAKAIFVPRMEQMGGAEEIKKMGINIPENPQEVTSTWDEAQEVGNLIDHRGYKSVILVTSKYHSRRAYLIFKDALKGKATVISAPSPYDTSDPDLWWKREKDAKKVFMEYQKLLVYYWRKVF